MYRCKFGQNPLSDSEDRLRKMLILQFYKMVTLNIRVESQKSTLYYVTLKQYIKFGQNPPLSSRENERLPFSVQNVTFQSAGTTLEMRSRSPKD